MNNSYLFTLLTTHYSFKSTLFLNGHIYFSCFITYTVVLHLANGYGGTLSITIVDVFSGKCRLLK